MYIKWHFFLYRLRDDLPGFKMWSRYENHRICSQKSAIISPFLQIWFHIYFEKEDLITEYEIKSF